MNKNFEIYSPFSNSLPTETLVSLIKENLLGKPVRHTEKKLGELIFQIKDVRLLSISLIQSDEEEILKIITQDAAENTITTRYPVRKVKIRVFSDSIIFSIGARYDLPYTAVSIFFKEEPH